MRLKHISFYKLQATSCLCLIVFLLTSVAEAAPPTGAVKFVILQ
ncbi:MAG: hypothetical protein G01um101429_1114, partial [Parcubacteria group bacterium Gr01-1014_29]